MFSLVLRKGRTYIFLTDVDVLTGHELAGKIIVLRLLGALLLRVHVSLLDAVLGGDIILCRSSHGLDGETQLSLDRVSVECVRRRR